MSRLNRKLHLQADRQRHPAMTDPLPMMDVNEEWIAPPSLPEQRHYNLRVTFEQSVRFNDGQRSKMTPTLAVASARRGIIESVFGEFREHFGKLHAALAAGDHDTLSQRLGEFEAAMFDASQEDWWPQ